MPLDNFPKPKARSQSCCQQGRERHPPPPRVAFHINVIQGLIHLENNTHNERSTAVKKIQQSKRHERTTAFLNKQALLADNRCFKKQSGEMSGEPAGSNR